MRIPELAHAKGVKIIWRPFLLGPIFKSIGWDTSPFLLHEKKGNYVWHDMIRQCEKYDLPWTRPSEFPRNAVLANRVALVNAEQPWIADYCSAVMISNFSSDQNITNEQVIVDILDTLELDGATLVTDAQSILNKPRLRAQTEEAMTRGVFGAPTFFANGAMFWGNDRLDDALDYATQLTTAD